MSLELQQFIASIILGYSFYYLIEKITPEVREAISIKYAFMKAYYDVTNNISFSKNLNDILSENDISFVTFTGKGGSGKDYALEMVKSSGVEKEVSYTSRPKRDNEVDGVDYHFITEESFKYKIANSVFSEYDLFNGWYYGKRKVLLTEENPLVTIYTPRGIETFRNTYRRDFIKNNCIQIILDIDETTIRERLTKRGDIDGVERRIIFDNKDFKDIDNGLVDFDITIEKPKFKKYDVYKAIIQQSLYKNSNITCDYVIK